MTKKNYRTLKKLGRDEYIEKKSRFIGTAKPVQTEEEALAFINAIRKEFSDATHNVYAYILKDNNIARFSDDGEPGGTAGLPVMEVLKQEDLTNVAVVVTRYFGGTLLGAGGLVRSYSKTAKLAVDAGIVSVMTDCTLIKIQIPYELYGRLQYLLEQEGLSQEESDFGQEVSVVVCTKTEQLEELDKKITENTNGRATCSILHSEYRPIEI